MAVLAGEARRTSEDCDIAVNEVYSRYSRRAKVTSTRYYAAKYMTGLMKEEIGG